MKFAALFTVLWISTVVPAVAGSPQGPGSFAVPDRGGQSTTSSGTGETLRVGYGRIRADAGSSTPSGIAIFQFTDSDGVLISEAGVPAAEPVGYRAGIGVAVVATFLLIWVNGAVGIMGALFGRFQLRGMARALFGTALTQILVAVIALLFGLGSSGPGWPRHVLILTGFFATLWVGSALLFLRADALDRK